MCRSLNRKERSISFPSQYVPIKPIAWLPSACALMGVCHRDIPRGRLGPKRPARGRPAGSLERLGVPVFLTEFDDVLRLQVPSLA